MKKLIQTRLHIDQAGNCFATVVACVMDFETAEDVIQVQEFYDRKDISWTTLLHQWLFERGWEWVSFEGHLYDDSFYFVDNCTKNNTNTPHVVIYKNGKLFHDPYPNGKGLSTINPVFQMIRKIDTNLVKSLIT